MAETKNDVNLRVGALVDFASLSVAEKAVGSFSDKIVSLAKWAGAAIAAGSVAVAIQRTADKFNDLGDVVSRVGNATVKELDRLGYVAELTGSDANTATASFENLSRTIGEAAQGIGRGALVFEKLGLSAKDAQGNVKTTTQVLDEIKVKIKDLSKAEQSAYIQRLGLDRSMIGMLTSDTTEIIDQYNKRTEALGINVDEAAELGAKYNDAIKVTKRGFDDIITAFVLRVLPSITTAIERVSKLIDENAGLINSYVEPISETVSIGANLVTGFITGLGKMFQVLGKWPIYIGLVTAAWKVLNMVFKASPIGRIITAVMTLITVLGLLYDDFKGWQEGKDSLIDWSFFSADWWKSKADTISNEMSLLGERIQGFLSDSWNNAITEASNKWDELKNTIFQKAQGVYDGIISTFVGLSTWFGDLWNSIGDGAMKALTNIGKAFTQWWNDLLDSIKNFGKSAAEKVENAASDALTATVDFVNGLNPFGSKDKSKTISSMPPSTTNNNQKTSNTYNNNSQVHQTITVSTAKEAKEVAGSTNRMYTQQGGIGGN